MRVVPIPPYLDDRTFDAVAAAIGDWPPGTRLLFDARPTRWASPFGFTALLTAGQALREAGLDTPRFAVPDSDDVRSYWAKAGFFQHAAELFEIHGKVPRRAPPKVSDVLLPVTPVRASEDVHAVVGRIQEQAARILTHELSLEAAATMRFSMALSEACQNVIEHAGTGGWVAVHAFNFRRRLGRKAVVIAVSDAGIGFRRSLEATAARTYGDRWNDAAAIQAALYHNLSRFREQGRGQGLASIKRFSAGWMGKISIRSGTARVSTPVEWDDEPVQIEGLAWFPGSQVQIVIPAKEPTASE